MQIRTIDEITLHRVMTAEDVERWALKFAASYRVIFGGPPYNERIFPSEAEQVFRRLTAVHGHVSLIAAVDDHVVGFGIAVPLKDYYSVAVELSGLVPLKHTMYLAEMGVMEAYRRRGLGRALTMERLRCIDAAAYSHVVLRVSTESGHPSHELYTSLEFQDMGVYMDVSAVRTDGMLRVDRRLFLSRVLSQVSFDAS